MRRYYPHFMSEKTHLPRPFLPTELDSNSLTPVASLCPFTHNFLPRLSYLRAHPLSSDFCILALSTVAGTK